MSTPDPTGNANPNADADESALAHLAQPDHLTFLLALALVAGNVVVGSRRVSAAAAALLAVSLGYDAYEFYRKIE